MKMEDFTQPLTELVDKNPKDTAKVLPPGEVAVMLATASRMIKNKSSDPSSQKFKEQVAIIAGFVRFRSEVNRCIDTQQCNLVGNVKFLDLDVRRPAKRARGSTIIMLLSKQEKVLQTSIIRAKLALLRNSDSTDLDELFTDVINPLRKFFSSPRYVNFAGNQ